MKVLIYTRKQQKAEMSSIQFKYASECVEDFIATVNTSRHIGMNKALIYGLHPGMACEVYRTEKKQISAVVYFK